MKCPECEKAGTPSRVYVGQCFVTCMGGETFYDEAGLYHDHDPNLRSTSYTCSLGHQWGESSRAACPVCGPNWTWGASSPPPEGESR